MLCVCARSQAFDQEGRNALIPPGVYSLDDLRELGLKSGWCPYFVARHAVRTLT